MAKFMKLKTPSLPSGLPSVPSLPSLPKLPSTPSLPSLPSTPKLPSLPSATALADSVTQTRAKLARGMSWVSDDDNSEEDKDPADLPPLEPVYIVLRPLALTEAPQTFLKGLGHVVKDFEFEHYLLLQHWGVLIGEHYYHLHIDDKDPNQRISVSMIPFVDIAKGEKHTLKIPIWRTRMTHDERVGIAVGIIKSMGNYDSEAQVDITDEKGHLITAEEVRERYTMRGRYKMSVLNALSTWRGGYNAVTNNCIHFTKHYILEQLVTRKKEMRDLTSNIQWLVGKWVESGCKRDPVELARFLTGILCINPFNMTPQKGARVMIKLLSIFLNVSYNPELDKKILDDDANNAAEALGEVPEASLGDQADSSGIEAEIKALKVEGEK